MTVKIIKEKIDDQTQYKVRCTDKSCRKLLQYTKLDIKKGKISIGGGRDTEPYIGISCPACAQVLREGHLKIWGRKIKNG